MARKRKNMRDLLREVELPFGQSTAYVRLWDDGGKGPGDFKVTKDIAGWLGCNVKELVE